MKTENQIKARIQKIVDPDAEGADLRDFLGDFLDEGQQAELAALEWVLE